LTVGLMAWSGYIRDLVSVGGFELGTAEVPRLLCRRVPLYQPMYWGDGAPDAGPVAHVGHHIPSCWQGKPARGVCHRNEAGSSLAGDVSDEACCASEHSQ
jgi:hypothetical protein